MLEKIRLAADILKRKFPGLPDDEAILVAAKLAEVFYIPPRI